MNYLLMYLYYGYLFIICAVQLFIWWPVWCYLFLIFVIKSFFRKSFPFFSVIFFLYYIFKKGQSANQGKNVGRLGPNQCMILAKEQKNVGAFSEIVLECRSVIKEMSFEEATCQPC